MKRERKNRRASRSPKRKTASAPAGSWDLSRLFPSAEAARRELLSLPSGASLKRQLAGFRGRLQSLPPPELCQLLARSFALSDRLSVLASYATLLLSNDHGDAAALRLQRLVKEIEEELGEALDWIDLELEQSPRLAAMAKKSAYQPYCLYFTWMLTDRKINISAETEKALNSLGEASLSTPEKINRQLLTVDLKPKKAKDSNGKTYPVTLATMPLLIATDDRTLRQSCWQSFMSAVETVGGTLSQSFISHVQNQSVVTGLSGENSLLRHQLSYNDFNSTLLAEELIEAARSMKSLLTRARRLRSVALGVKKLAPWDLEASWGEANGKRISLTEAKELISRAVAALGPEVVSLVEKAFDERWIDSKPRKEKLGGDFCRSVAGHMPFISISYDGSLLQLFTLAHELGHAVHYALLNQYQHPIYSGSPSIVGELPSTLFEIMLSNYLLGQRPELEERLVSHAIYNLEASFFRQVKFFQFERLLYQKEEDSRGSLDFYFFDKSWSKLTRYWKSPVEIVSPLEDYSWIEHQHIFNDYYVILYPLSYVSALYLAQELEKNSEKAAKKILAMLKAGDTLTGRGALESVGVNLERGAVYSSLRRYYLSLIRRGEEQLGKRGGRRSRLVKDQKRKKYEKSE